jgi:hypothetical protein
MSAFGPKRTSLACATSHLIGGYGPSGNFSRSASGLKFPPALGRSIKRFDGMHVGGGTKLRKPDELSESVPFGLKFDHTGIPRDFTPHTVITEVFYIGLGDQFDDDRRRIRQFATAVANGR